MAELLGGCNFAPHDPSHYKFRSALAGIILTIILAIASHDDVDDDEHDIGI